MRTTTYNGREYCVEELIAAAQDIQPERAAILASARPITNNPRC